MSDKAKGSTLIKDALALFAITLVAALLLGLVNEVTKGPIEEQLAKAKKEAYMAVFKEAEEVVFDDETLKSKVSASDELLDKASVSKVKINEAGIVVNSDNKALGYVVSVTSKSGYSGDITITMGLSADRKITGIEFITINETAGFGLKATEEAFKSQFTGKSGTEKLSLVKADAGEHEMDAISGATKSSKAIQDAVNGGIVFLNDLLDNGIGGVSE